MTPEQKESHRREVLEEAAKVADRYRAMWCNAGGFGGHSAGARIIADAIRALAASQPAPAADTTHVCPDCGLPLSECCAPAADTGQAVAGVRDTVLWAVRQWQHKMTAEELTDAILGAPAVADALAHPAPLDAERVWEDAPIWGKWYPHNEAPKGSYACLYQKGDAPVSLAWMPAQGRPDLVGAVVMPFPMPSDKGDAR